MTKLSALLLAIAFAPAAFAMEEQSSPPIGIPQGEDPCRLDLSVKRQVYWNGLYGRGYEAGSSIGYEPAQLAISHSGAACDFFIVISNVDEGLSGPGGRLAYDILDTPGGRSLDSRDPLGSPFTRLSGAFSQDSGTIDEQLFVSIPSGQALRTGSYTGGAILRLYRDGALPELISQVQLPIIVPIAPVLSISSADLGFAKSASISLGNLEAGGRAQIGFVVDTNMPISIRAESENAGTLRHEHGVASIPYRTTVEGQIFDLSAGAASRSIDIAPGVGKNVLIAIDTDPQKGAPAGSYSDTLTLIFSSEG